LSMIIIILMFLFNRYYCIQYSSLPLLAYCYGSRAGVDAFFDDFILFFIIFMLLGWIT
jgi:hypothetical protein